MSDNYMASFFDKLEAERREMSGVKRYIPDGYTQPASRSGTGTHMVECRDGDYVLASDYDAMQAERDGANERAGLLLKAVLATEADLDQAVRTAEYWKAEHLAGNAVIDKLRAEVEQLRQQASRYERLRRLDPRQFAELHQRNLAGERLDDMVDAL